MSMSDKAEPTCLQGKPGWQGYTCSYARNWCDDPYWGVDARDCCPATCGQRVFPVALDTVYTADLAWEVTNDRVMGGISYSEVVTVNDGGTQVAKFFGTATTDSNGGFANSRAIFDEPVDFSACRGVELEVKGDGQRYVFDVQPSRGRRGTTYEVDIYPTANWKKIPVPFSSLTAQASFGSRARANPTLDASRIYSFGIKRTAFLSGFRKDPDFRKGDFDIRIKSIG